MREKEGQHRNTWDWLRATVPYAAVPLICNSWCTYKNEKYRLLSLGQNTIFFFLMGTVELSRVTTLGHRPLPCREIEFSPVYSWGGTTREIERPEPSAAKWSTTDFSTTGICPWKKRFLYARWTLQDRGELQCPAACFGITEAVTESHGWLHSGPFDPKRHMVWQARYEKWP